MSTPQPSRQTSHRPDGVTARVVALRPEMPVAAVQGALALDLQPRTAPPPVSAPGEDGAVRSRSRAHAVDGWARRYVQAVVEIVGGDRPASQLVRWSNRTVQTDLERRAQLVARSGDHMPGAGRVQPVRPRVLSVHTCEVSEDVVETAAHVSYGHRSRAVAARFRRHEGRWVCTALDFA
ncbi:MAG: hypothetical protein CMH83_16705 [Nocardioides sp.]|nr:hypothetical protein [Nocardioides sp.]